MPTLLETNEVAAVGVDCTADGLTVVLGDGRKVTAPLACFPRLARATPTQRSSWELMGDGLAIHWEEIDEDILVASLVNPENYIRLPSWA